MSQVRARCLVVEQAYGMCRVAEKMEPRGKYKNRGNELNNFFRISESSKKRTENELKTNSKMRRKQCNQDAKCRVAHTCRRSLAGCMRPVGAHRRMGAYIARNGVATYAPPNFHQISRAEGPWGQTSSARCLRQPQKMLKIVGTNSTTPLESVKVSKNELKTNWFLSAKSARLSRKHALSGAINSPGAQNELKPPS